MKKHPISLSLLVVASGFTVVLYGLYMLACYLRIPQIIFVGCIPPELHQVPDSPAPGERGTVHKSAEVESHA